jgi:hypothetical protein
MEQELNLLKAILPVLAGHPPGKLPPADAISWPFFLRLTKVHRLSPLFFHLFGVNDASPPQPGCRPRRLTEAAYNAAAGPLSYHDLPGYFPREVRSAWEEEYNAALWKTVLVQDGLQRALEALHARGAETIVLKGAHLAQAYYPHPALRLGDDVDLLVRKETAEKARAALAETDWEFVSETKTALKFSRPGPGGFRAFLEVHTDLQTPLRRNPSFDIRIADFWGKSREEKVLGAPVRVLRPETEIFYLAAHLSHHGFSRLIWFYDLHLIAARSGFAWEDVARSARESVSAAAVWCALLRTQALFGSPVPERALKELSPSGLKIALLGKLFGERRILEGESLREGSLSLFERFALNDDWGRAAKSFISHLPWGS